MGRWNGCGWAWVGRYTSRATKVSKRYGNNNNNFCNSAGAHAYTERSGDENAPGKLRAEAEGSGEGLSDA